MKAKTTLILCLCLVLGIAVGAYFWATGMMDSLYAFRSPIKNTPPPAGEALNPAQTQLSDGGHSPRRVVFILVDALRLDTSLDPQVMPVLNDLRASGASAVMRSQPPSYSEPGYSTLFTGAWPYLNDGPALNLPYEEIPTWTQDNLFSVLHDAGMKTALSAYYWFEKLIPQKAVDASFYTAGEDRLADEQVVNHALRWLEDPAYRFVFIHLDQLDYAGHYEGGPLDPRWAEAAARCDKAIGQIAGQLDFSQDMLVIASDHGQIDAGGHGGHDPVTLLEPVVFAGAGVQPGVYDDIQMVDLAPTLAALFGARLPASTQGQVQTAMFTLSPETLHRLPGLTLIQQNRLMRGYLSAIGAEIDEARLSGAYNVPGFQAILEDARADRTNQGRLSRAFLVCLLIAVPWVLLAYYRPRRWLYYTGGGLLAIALFHLRYALLDGLAYSLSPVISATDLIVYVALTAAVALLVAWLVLFFLLKLYRAQPLQAALETIVFVVCTLSLLGLPIAWNYIVNGLLITWTLPAFGTSFVGLISLMQALVTALAGMLFSGLAAFIAWLVQRID